MNSDFFKQSLTEAKWVHVTVKTPRVEGLIGLGCGGHSEQKEGAQRVKQAPVSASVAKLWNTNTESKQFCILIFSLFRNVACITNYRLCPSPRGDKYWRIKQKFWPTPSTIRVYTIETQIHIHTPADTSTHTRAYSQIRKHTCTHRMKCLVLEQILQL